MIDIIMVIAVLALAVLAWHRGRMIKSHTGVIFKLCDGSERDVVAIKELFSLGERAAVQISKLNELTGRSIMKQSKIKIFRDPKPCTSPDEKHDFTGSVVKVEFLGIDGETVTCKYCGMTKMHYDMHTGELAALTGHIR